MVVSTLNFHLLLSHPFTAALARAQGERNAAEAGAAGTRHRQGPADRSIARPRNMAKTTIRDIRSQLDLTGNKNDQAWADLRVCIYNTFSIILIFSQADVRRFMDAGMLDLSMGWKEQDNRRLAKVYDAVRGPSGSIYTISHNRTDRGRPS